MNVLPNYHVTHHRLRMRSMKRHHITTRPIIIVSSIGIMLLMLTMYFLGVGFIFVPSSSSSKYINNRKHTDGASIPVSNNSNNGNHSILRVGNKALREHQFLQQLINSNTQPFNQHNEILNAKHLIMVAGHSVTTISNHLQDAGEDETDWYLLPYQKGKGLPQTILAHIREGIKLAAMDPHSILIFSGGETRAATGPENEGTSYFRVADAMNLWEEGVARGKSVRARTTSEEFATDSFQNLLFSICRFREITGVYPEKITTVSFTFKQRRFESMHSRAILWPSDQFFYVGVDPDASTGFDIDEATRGELESAAKPFQEDPYGCHTDILQEKRRMRNPFHRTAPYEITCPEMKELLKWCGPNIIDKEKIPWWVRKQ